MRAVTEIMKQQDLSMQGGQGLSPGFFFLGICSHLNYCSRWAFPQLCVLLWGEENQKAVRFWRGWNCLWGKSAAESMWLG